MRDYDNAAAIWNEFHELPDELHAFRQFVLDNSEGRIVVVGDNNGLLSAGLGDVREVVLVRHFDELHSEKVAAFDAAMKDYSRGTTRAHMFLSTPPLAQGKYTCLDGNLFNAEFFQQLDRDTTLVGRRILHRFYEQRDGIGSWIEQVTTTPLQSIIVTNSKTGKLNLPEREAKYLEKYGWPVTKAEDDYVLASRQRR